MASGRSAQTDSVIARMTPPSASRCYRELSLLLGEYISPLLVHSTLRSALGHKGTTAESLGRSEVSAVVEHAMIGLRLFCEPERLPDLMVELAEYCARASP